MAVLRIVPNLPARDPAALSAWYSRVLGLKPVMDLGFIITLTGTGKQDPQLSLASEGGARTDLPAVSIEVDDLDPVIMQAGEAVVYGPAIEDWGVRRIYLRDPEGNLVNVLQHI